MKEKLIKSSEIWRGHDEISIFEDEFIVDVSSVLGAYCGSFICNEKTFIELEKFNKSSKGANYFNRRGYKTIQKLLWFRLII